MDSGHTFASVVTTFLWTYGLGGFYPMTPHERSLDKQNDYRIPLEELMQSEIYCPKNLDTVRVIVTIVSMAKDKKWIEKNVFY